MSPAARCQKCLSYLPPGTERCPECGGGRSLPRALRSVALGLASVAVIVAVGVYSRRLAMSGVGSEGQEPRTSGPPTAGEVEHERRAPEPFGLATDPGDPPTPAPVEEDRLPAPGPARRAFESWRRRQRRVALHDVEGILLKTVPALPLFEGEALLLALEHLNGVSHAQAQGADGVLRRFELVALLDSRGAALLIAASRGRSFPMDPGLPRRLGPEIEEGLRLFVVSEPGTQLPYAVAGVVAGPVSADGLWPVREAGFLKGRLVMDAEARWIGLGLAASAGGQGLILGVAALERACQECRPMTLLALQDLLFQHDGAARRELAALYVSGSHWSGAAQHFVAAVELAPALRQEVEETATLALRLAVRQAIEQRQAAPLIELLERAVRVFPGNPGLLHALGVLWLDQGEEGRAIAALGDALSYGARDDPEVLEALHTAFLRLGEGHRKEGRLAQAVQAYLDGLYELPEDLLLLKGLGYAYYDSGENALAYDTLSQLAALDAGQSGSLQGILQRLEERLTAPEATQIRFNPREGAIRALATLNGRREISVIVDTGATITAITPSVARSLGIDANASARRAQVVTANGTVSAPVITLRSVDLGGARQTSVDALVLPLGDETGTEGLIGLNFLRHFDVRIDGERGILHLRPLR